MRKTVTLTFEDCTEEGIRYPRFGAMPRAMFAAAEYRLGTGTLSRVPLTL